MNFPDELITESMDDIPPGNWKRVIFHSGANYFWGASIPVIFAKQAKQSQPTLIFEDPKDVFKPQTPTIPSL